MTGHIRKSIAICLLLIAAAGCQQRPTTVSGTITLDGRPLSVPSDARGTVVFQPDGGRGTMATGLLDPVGHFDLATGSSREVAPGKYYVTVSVAQLTTKNEQEEQGTRLITPAKYVSASESGLAAEVQPGENELHFDLNSTADETSVEAAKSTSKTPSPEEPPTSGSPES
jgi:hypothetical protein